MRNYIFAFPERQKFTGYSYSLTREKIMTNPRRTGDSSGDAGTDTWLDLPAGKIGPPSGADIAILGIGAATPYPGGSYCMEAPDAVRQALRKPGLLGYHDFDLGGLDAGSTILPDGITAEDQGNLQVDDTVDPEKTAANRARITAAVRAMLDSDTTPVLFGGDDSVPIPVLAAYAGTPSVSILQIDAHIDWRDERFGERWGLSSTMRRASEMDHVGRVVQLAARGIGSARSDDLRAALEYGTCFHPMRQLREQDGIAAAVADLPAGVPVFVSLDVDGLDPAIMPAVRGPSHGGLGYWQLVDILEAAAARAPIAGFAMVELEPARDIGGHGALLAARIALSALGIIARQRTARSGP